MLHVSRCWLISPRFRFISIVIVPRTMETTGRSHCHFNWINIPIMADREASTRYYFIPPVGKIYLTKSGCFDNRVETDHRVEQNFHRICVYFCRECIRKTGFNRTLFFLLAKKHWIHHEMNRIKLTFFSRV